MDPTFPVLMTCPTRKVPVYTGRRASREEFPALEFGEVRFTCAACGGEHLLEREMSFLGERDEV